MKLGWKAVERQKDTNKGNYEMDFQVKIDQAPNCLTRFVFMLLHYLSTYERVGHDSGCDDQQITLS